MPNPVRSALRHHAARTVAATALAGAVLAGGITAPSAHADSQLPSPRRHPHQRLRRRPPKQSRPARQAAGARQSCTAPSSARRSPPWPGCGPRSSRWPRPRWPTATGLAAPVRTPSTARDHLVRVQARGRHRPATRLLLAVAQGQAAPLSGLPARRSRVLLPRWRAASIARRLRRCDRDRRLVHDHP